MRFHNKTGKYEVDKAIAMAENLFDESLSPMLDELRKKKDWKYGLTPHHDVALALSYPRSAIDVVLYTPLNPFTKAIGYFDGKRIHINSRKLHKLWPIDLVGLLIHEYAHYCGFGHGNNYKTKEKCLYSVPYYLSENVARWVPAPF